MQEIIKGAERLKIEFTIPGEPVAKGRPNFSRQGNFVRAYTPEKTTNYETLVRFLYCEKAKGEQFPSDMQLKITIKAYLSIPKSVSKKKQAGMASGAIRPIKRPDTDNIVKAVLDGLNTVAFRDDSQVVEISAGKWYSDEPRAEIIIEEVA